MYTWEMKTIKTNQKENHKNTGFTVQTFKPTENFSTYGSSDKNRMRRKSSRVISIHSLVKKMMAAEWAGIKRTRSYKKVSFLKEKLIGENLENNSY
jgi:hypothetical protein